MKPETSASAALRQAMDTELRARLDAANARLNARLRPLPTFNREREEAERNERLAALRCRMVLSANA